MIFLKWCYALNKQHKKARQKFTNPLEYPTFFGVIMVSNMFNKYVVFLSLGLVLMGCSTPHERAEAPQSTEDKRKLGFGSLAGPEGFTLGGDKVSGRTVDGGGNVVNRYLWQASLDTLQFVPLVSSDGPGGVLVSDWYHPSNAKDRLKIQVRIKSKQLRSDALEVTVYKQVRDKSEWRDAGIDLKAARELENIILLKARDIRVKAREES